MVRSSTGNARKGVNSGAERAGERGAAFGVGVQDDDADAARREPADGGAPEPAGAAGDDRGSTGEVHHPARAAARTAAMMPW
jgi:hypothetical protein